MVVSYCYRLFVIVVIVVHGPMVVGLFVVVVAALVTDFVAL